jgi:hypothetical protein
MTAAPSIAAVAATPSAARAQDFIARSVVGAMRIGHVASAPFENRSACPRPLASASSALTPRSGTRRSTRELRQTRDDEGIWASASGPPMWLPI